MAETQYPRVQVKGGPRERGRQYGEQVRDRVRRSVEAYGEVFGHYASLSWAQTRDLAQPFVPVIEAFEPRYLEELRGIAQGAGLDFEDLLALNLRTEVMFSGKLRAMEEAERGSLGGCSAIAALPPRTSDGHTLLSQNWDWLVHTRETTVVLEAEQEDGPNFVTVVEAGLLTKTGMNAHGIGLVTNTIVSAADHGEPGVPYHVLLRSILDAPTLPDALGRLQQARRSSSANYLIGSEEGLAVDVEAAPGDFSQLTVEGPRNGLLAHTNHFVSPRFRETDVSLFLMPDSALRLQRIESLLATHKGAVTADLLGTIYADHASHPLGVCCHEYADKPLVEQEATVASIIMDLDDRRMLLADGNPCRAPYRTLEYAELLKG